jgi:hypothetical protein
MQTQAYGKLTAARSFGHMHSDVREGLASYCHECKRPVSNTDNRGQLLKGTCNIWWSMSGDKVRLSEEDLHAFHQLRRKK